MRRQAISVMTIGIVALAVILAASIALYLMLNNVSKLDSVKPQVPVEQKIAPKPAPAKGPRELPPPTTVVIKAISRSEFRPSFVDISVGSTIIWENVDIEAHTATSENVTAAGSPLFHSMLNPGERFQMKFDKPGTYYYQCVVAYHAMSGIIRVSG